MTTESDKPRTQVTRRAASQKQLEFRLDEWPEHVRGSPNVLLRSALFGIRQVRPISRKLTPIAAPDGIEIRFKGEHFNQDDLDVWEALVHRARKQPLGTYVRFTVNEILRELDRDTGGSQHSQFHEELARLQGGVIEMRSPQLAKKLSETLVGKSRFDEASETYALMLSEDLLKMYQTGYSWIDAEECKLFRKNALARYLYRFYTTHAEPFPYKVATLRDYCGSSTPRLTDFRKALRIALELLKKNKAILDWKIDPRRDTVEIVKIPTPSQRRHLAKKRAEADKSQVDQNEMDFNSPDVGDGI